MTLPSGKEGGPRPAARPDSGEVLDRLAELVSLTEQASGLGDVVHWDELEIQVGAELRRGFCERIWIVGLDDGETARTVETTQELKECLVGGRRPLPEDLKGTSRRSFIVRSGCTAPSFPCHYKLHLPTPLMGRAFVTWVWSSTAFVPCQLGLRMLAPIGRSGVFHGRGRRYFSLRATFSPLTARLTAGPGRTHEDLAAKGAPDGRREPVLPDIGTGERGVDHDIGGHHQPDVFDIGRPAAEEDQIAGCGWHACWKLRSGIELLLGHPGQGDA